MNSPLNPEDTSADEADGAFPVLRKLNEELGKEGTQDGPVRMVVLGGALAVRHFKSRAETVAVDVILDPHFDAAQGYQDRLKRCIRRVGCATNLGPGWMSGHYTEHFTREARGRAFHQSVSQGGRPELYEGSHLKVYAMDTQVALEMKLRRMLDRNRNAEWDSLDATAFLFRLTEGGMRPKSFAWCQRLGCDEKRGAIPGKAVQIVKTKFEKLHKNRQGIVDMDYDEQYKRWRYKNLQGNWVWVSQSI